MTAPELSLCVGVTGHRDIEVNASAAVEALVREAFARLEKGLACPITVLSSLAEGADRLVARIGLERGHQLIVPLPLAVEDYATDFATPESRREFDELLGRATRVFVVERLVAHTGEEARDVAYRSAGTAVARNCHLLLALWDGVDNGKPGGTSDIVHFKLRGEHGMVVGLGDSLSHKPRGAVVHVITPRESDGEKPAVGIKWPEPHGAVWLRVAAMARRIRRFNHDAAQLAAKKPERIAESRCFLDGEKPAASVEVAALKRLSSLYAVADALAIQRQTEVRIGWKWLLCWGVLGVILLGQYAHAHKHDYPWGYMLGYLGTVALVVGSYRSMTRRHTQPRFLEYRALAEALRVAFFWHIAGLPGEPADRYPGHLAL